MGVVASLLWSYAVASYVSLFPQNSPQALVNAKPKTTTTTTSSTRDSRASTTTTTTTTKQDVKDGGVSVVGKVEDFEDGKMVEVSVGKEKILIIREGDTFSAIGAKCTHARQNLAKGAYSKGRVRCPLHGACFSTKTGDIEDHPGCDAIPVFPVRVEKGQVIVQASEEALRKSAVTQVVKKQVPGDNQTFIIIGGGPAGGAAAETLRAENFTGRIILINREMALPYDRPKLSKVMNTPLEKCFLRTREFYETRDIELLLGTEVTELDALAKTVKLNNDQILKYDKALIATGADCQRLAFIPGHDASNVHVLRTAEDANRIWSSVEGKKVLIVGSSFIGMEVASCIADKCKVTVIGMEKVPFERVLGKEVGLIMQKFHESKGIRFIMDAICKQFKKTESNQVTSVELKDGTIIDDVDLVILGAGVLPATSYIKAYPELKLARDKSVIVDRYLYTGVDGLWAAGDLARFPLALLNNTEVRIEHYGMAQAQGVIAAKNMLAGPVVACNNVPFFWTVQYGKSIRYCGHALEYEQVILDNVEPDPQTSNFGFIAYYIHNNLVDAVCSLNRDPVVAEVAELMHSQIPLRGDDIEKSIAQHGNSHIFIKSKLYPQLK